MRKSRGPSVAYEAFEQAMRRKKQIRCTYRGYLRELCPVILGHTEGQEKALTYQIGGGSRSGLPRGGEWRCLFLSEVSGVRLGDGPWRTGSSHSHEQKCVQDVDLDVNPVSPYAPKRRLD